MKEKPILFNTEMVKAILDGRKTETRRTSGLDKYPDLNWFHINRVNGEDFKCALADLPDQYILLRPPYGQPGDLLWVREKMIKNNNSQTYWPVADGYYKHAAYEKVVPSIHMPKAASRIWLMVEDIRVERVQDITDEGAFREGIIPVSNPPLKGEAYIDFLNLWESINGKDSWLQNQWVWVVKFRVLSTTGRPSEEIIEAATSDISYHKSDV